MKFKIFFCLTIFLCHNFLKIEAVNRDYDVDDYEPYCAEHAMQCLISSDLLRYAPDIGETCPLCGDPSICSEQIFSGIR